MHIERMLAPAEAATAGAIQAAIDELAAAGGGRLVLPAMDLTLDRGLELRGGIELLGQGDATILRKGPGRIYPLTGYHTYGMRDVPLRSTAGLQAGMTVSIQDDVRQGFYATFARIIWIDGNWAGLDRGLSADYLPEANPCLTTAYPLLFGRGIRHAAIRSLHLEGSRGNNDAAMDACRGSALYLYQSHDVDISDVSERDYRGEGLGYQMCSDIRVRRCAFNENTGNGFHPGAGSTQTSFHDCTADANGHSGFFFCVRANHITVDGCRFAANATGMSIGARDCHNLIRGCTFAGNAGAGIHARRCPPPTEVHSLHIHGCMFEENGAGKDQAQIELEPEAHTLIIENCRLGGPLGIRGHGGLRNLFLAGNTGPARMVLPDQARVNTRPAFAAGYEAATLADKRHLKT